LIRRSSAGRALSSLVAHRDLTPFDEAGDQRPLLTHSSSSIASNAGHFKMGAQHYFISHALTGDNLGLEAIDDGL
jgi:hypothetical protein